MGNKLTHNTIALAAFALFSLMGLGAQAASTTINIAAVVGDDVITTTDVNERRDLIMATSGIPNTVENQQKMTPRILQSLIDETLQTQEAKRQSLTVSDDEVAKAVASMDKRPGSNETLSDFIKARGLSQRSFENQVRSQVAWGKVVQRKIKRNVNVSQDEVVRAQQASAASPGEEELRLSAIEISGKGKEAPSTKLAEEVVLQLKAGTDMATVATRYIKQPEVHYNPPLWVPSKNLPPALQQAMRSMKPGEATPPLPGPNGLQVIQLLDRNTAPKQADTTEYAIKQIMIPIPAKKDKASLAKLRALGAELRSNPGDCMSEAIPKSGMGASAKFVRLQLGALSPEQRSVVTHLDVGEISEPLMAPDALRLVMMCEKIEPSTGNTPASDTIRQQLFTEKLELEAAKYMRNLRRDAYIDIKGTN